MTLQRQLTSWDTSQPEHWTIHMPNLPEHKSTRVPEAAGDDA